jgi:hypothetical protein
MCGIVEATIALSAISAATGAYAQQQTAKAQASAIGRQQESERQETTEAAEEELGQRIRANREARARARVASGESGVGGQSFAASLNQSLQDQDETAALAAKNVAFAQRAIDDRANVALAGIRSPSALEAGLRIASAGVQGYSAGLSLQSRIGTSPLPEIGSIVEASSTTGPLPIPGQRSA